MSRPVQPDHEQWGRAMRHALDHLPRKAACRALGVSPSTLARKLDGRGRITLPDLVFTARAAGVTVYDLIRDAYRIAEQDAGVLT